jgi:hypothetical protein
MSDELDALNELKSILAADLDPTPEPAPLYVWVYPEEYQAIDAAAFAANKLPIIIVRKAYSKPISVGQMTYSRSLNVWPAWIDVHIGADYETNYIKTAQAIMHFEPWIHAMRLLLSQNLQLNRQVQSIGDDAGNLFTYRAGKVPRWVENPQTARFSAGIRFELMITQTPSQPVSS